MEELREELHSYIDKYGLTDPRTIMLSQELDNPVNEEMKILNKKVCHGCGDEIKVKDKYVKMGDLILCEYCIENNWYEEE